MLARMYRNYVNGTAILEIIWQFLTKLNLQQSYGPAISLLDILSQRNENLCSHKLYVLMFIPVLFIIAKNQKQPKSPWRDEWWNKLWYIHAMEYCEVT